MKTNIIEHTTKELLERVSKLDSFKSIPLGYWVLGCRSKVNEFNTYDDKFYLMQGETNVGVMTGTTNAGAEGVLNFDKYGLKGVAQIKHDEWYYDVWTRGRHKGKMNALVQTGGFKVHRDKDKNKKVGDVTEWMWEYAKGLNFHCNSYDPFTKVIVWIIGSWSLGCQVSNEVIKFNKFIDSSLPQNKFTYCLIEEF